MGKVIKLLRNMLKHKRIKKYINIKLFLNLFDYHSFPLLWSKHIHTPHYEVVASICFSLQDILIQKDQGSPGAGAVKPYLSHPAFH